MVPAQAYVANFRTSFRGIPAAPEGRDLQPGRGPGEDERKRLEVRRFLRHGAHGDGNLQMLQVTAAGEGGRRAQSGLRYAQFHI